ncbi:MAG: hypothetical protein MUP76_05660, partial [Acidimicrobiia bacterium]|nr:hypothetical protein [Acidimicrobiia bacterium]
LGCRTSRGSEYYRGAYMARAIIRITDRVGRVLVKGPLLADGRRPRARIADDANLLHFDAYSYGLWLLKWQWRRDGSATPLQMRAERGRLMDEFETACRAGEEAGLRRLFRRWHMVAGWERIVLRSLGLLRRIRIDPALFREAS